MRSQLVHPLLVLAVASAAQAATPTWTTLTSSGNPTIVGQAVTFTATVKVIGGGGPPTGSVTFKDIATVLGTVTLDGTGKATLTTSALARGTHAITATYGGDASFSSSTSEVLSQSTPNGGPCSVPSFYTGTASSIERPLTVGDMNLDGKPDVVTTGFLGGAVRVVLGDGTGSFLPPGTAVAAGAAFSPAPMGGAAPVADFNLDGKPDVAVPRGSGVAVLLGDGSGGLSMAPGSPVATTLSFPQLASADFNLDGKPDVLLVVSVNDAGGSTAGRATLLLGDGTGGLTPTAVDLNLGSGPTFAVADFNQDGRPDLIVNAGSPATLSTFLGDGNAGFVSGPVSSPGFASGDRLKLGDFNLDGKTDIVGFRSYVHVLIGDGTGNFSARASAFDSIGSVALLVKDFNLDGKLDLLAGTAGAVLLGDGVLAPGTSGFDRGPAIVGGMELPVTHEAHDFNSDGAPDVATLDNTTFRIRFNSCPAPGSVAVGIASAPNPSTSGQAVTLTATISVASGSGVPAGQVQFRDGSSNFDRLSIGSPVSVTNGVATLTTSGLTDGQHSISAVYTGDASFGWATSTSLTQKVLPRLTIDDRTANSATDTTMTFTVRLTAAIDDTVSVAYSTSDRSATAGVDYTATSGTLVLAAGEASKTISVPITKRTTPVPERDFFITLSNPSNATISKSTGTGTIRHSAPGTLQVYVDDPTVKEGNTGTTLLAFTVSLSRAADLSVDYATADGTGAAGTDYTTTSGTLTFRNGATIRTILVPIPANTTASANRTLSVNLSNLKDGYVTPESQIAKSQGTGTIVDDDPAGAASLIDMYRLYGDKTTYEHLYTTDLNEYNVLGASYNTAARVGWQQEGIAYRLLSSAGTFNGDVGIPLYRLYNHVSRQHHWSTDANEAVTLAKLQDWNYEGIVGYVLSRSTSATGVIPLYRLWDKGILHLWTTGANEKLVLSTQRGWIYEDIVGNVIP
jgi:hypothetical protein